MIENKIKKLHTYLVATNYWAPLNNDNDKYESEEEEANVIKSASTMAMPKTNKWTRCMARQQ